MKENNETSCNCFKLGGEEVKGGGGGEDLTNVQCKLIRNCHNESLLYHENILIKMKENEL
jgi:hypothetical protein